MPSSEQWLTVQNDVWDFDAESQSVGLELDQLQQRLEGLKRREAELRFALRALRRAAARGEMPVLGTTVELEVWAQLAVAEGLELTPEVLRGIPQEGSFVGAVLSALTREDPACEAWVRNCLRGEVLDSLKQLLGAERLRRRPSRSARLSRAGSQPGIGKTRSQEMPQLSVAAFIGEPEEALPSPPSSPKAARDGREVELAEPETWRQEWGRRNTDFHLAGRGPDIGSIARAVVQSLVQKADAAPPRLCRLAAALSGMDKGQEVLGRLLLTNWLAPALLNPGLALGLGLAEICPTGATEASRAMLTALAKLLGAAVAGGDEEKPLQTLLESLARRAQVAADLETPRAGEADLPACVVLWSSELQALGSSLSEFAELQLSPELLRLVARRPSGLGNSAVVCWLRHASAPKRPSVSPNPEAPCDALRKSFEGPPSRPRAVQGPGNLQGALLLLRQLLAEPRRLFSRRRDGPRGGPACAARKRGVIAAAEDRAFGGGLGAPLGAELLQLCGAAGGRGGAGAVRLSPGVAGEGPSAPGVPGAQAAWPTPGGAPGRTALPRGHPVPAPLCQGRLDPALRAVPADALGGPRISAGALCGGAPEHERAADKSQEERSGLPSKELITLLVEVICKHCRLSQFFQDSSNRQDDEAVPPQKLLEGDERLLADCVARFVFHQLHHRLFPTEPTVDDMRIRAQISRFSWLRPRHLELPRQLADTEQAEQAVELLQTLHSLRSPTEMLEVLAQAFRITTQAACLKAQLVAGGLCKTSQDNAFGADEAVPLFILIIVRANPPMMASVLSYAERFTTRDQQRTEQGYALAQAQAAVSFSASLRAQELSNLAPGEWEGHILDDPEPAACTTSASRIAGVALGSEGWCQVMLVAAGPEVTVAVGWRRESCNLRPNTFCDFTHWQMRNVIAELKGLESLGQSAGEPGPLAEDGRLQLAAPGARHSLLGKPKGLGFACGTTPKQLLPQFDAVSVDAEGLPKVLFSSVALVAPFLRRSFRPKPSPRELVDPELVASTEFFAVFPGNEPAVEASLCACVPLPKMQQSLDALQAILGAKTPSESEWGPPRIGSLGIALLRCRVPETLEGQVLQPVASARRGQRLRVLSSAFGLLKASIFLGAETTAMVAAVDEASGLLLLDTRSLPGAEGAVALEAGQPCALLAPPLRAEEQAVGGGGSRWALCPAVPVRGVLRAVQGSFASSCLPQSLQAGALRPGEIPRCERRRIPSSF
ncbi:unnamed protein product [Effrenium voratum]|nr:unnamed protein product [Effrenium voratum]